MVIVPAKNLIAVLIASLGFAQWTRAQYVADSSVIAGSGYSGGQYTMQYVPFPFPYTWTSQGWGGGTPSGTCSGQITAVFKWAGDSSAIPPAVLVEESCVARTYNELSHGVTAAGAANNDLGDERVVTQMPGNPQYLFEEAVSGKDTVEIKHYRIIYNPGSTVTLTLSPVASCSSASAGEATVRYKAKVTPIDIIFQGGIGNNWEKRYLIGQNVKATLQSDLTASNYVWTVNGGEPFDAFQITYDGTYAHLNTGHRIPPSAQTNATFSLCFAKDADIELSVTAHLDIPSGAKPAGGLNIGISRQFNTDKPDYEPCQEDIAYYLLLANDQVALVQSFLYDGSHHTGLVIRSEVNVPPGYASGNWTWAQLIHDYTTRVVDGVTYRQTTILGDTSGHDGNFPYDTVYGPYTSDLIEPWGVNDHWSTGVVGTLFDDPTITLESVASSYHVENQFEDFAMFLPSGIGSQHVPVRHLYWYLVGEYVHNEAGWFEWDEPHTAIFTGDLQFPDWSNRYSPINSAWTPVGGS